jgi:pyrroloquinoline quinone biosynthesis protein D
VTPQQDQVPRLAPGCVLSYDSVRGQRHLLMPERVVRLNETSAAVLGLCDGTRTLGQIVTELSSRFYGSGIENDVDMFFAEFRARGWVRW